MAAADVKAWSSAGGGGVALQRVLEVNGESRQLLGSIIQQSEWAETGTIFIYKRDGNDVGEF